MDATKYKRAQWAAAVIQAAYRGWKAKRDYLRKKAAAQKIQAIARGWVTRRKVDQMKERKAHEQRFDAAMERHRQRLYLLELDKREILAVPATELDDWQRKRHRAAAMVQAHWRGRVQRRKWAQREPERLRRDEEARRMQKAFRDMVGQARGAATAEQRQRQRLLDGMSPESPPESPRAAGTPDVSAPSRLAGVRPDQSANVLMGSPETAARASAPGLPRPGGASFDHDTGAVKFDEGVVRESVRASVQRRQAGPATYMSGKRYQDLKRQVEQQLEAYKAKAKHQRQDPRVVDARLNALLRSYTSSAEANIRAAHARQAALSASETLAAQLDSMPKLAELPADAQPTDYPRPARGSDRAARAGQAHALMLAEVRAGTRWWNHLRTLNHEAVQNSVLAEDADRWQALDQQWRRLWAAVQAEEAGRIDPDTGLHRPPVPPLSDLAITDEQDQAQRQRRWAQAQHTLMEGAMRDLALRQEQEAAAAASANDISAMAAQRPGSVPVIVVPASAPAMTFQGGAPQQPTRASQPGLVQAPDRQKQQQGGNVDLDPAPKKASQGGDLDLDPAPKKALQPATSDQHSQLGASAAAAAPGAGAGAGPAPGLGLEGQVQAEAQAAKGLPAATASSSSKGLAAASVQGSGQASHAPSRQDSAASRSSAEGAGQPLSRTPSAQTPSGKEAPASKGTTATGAGAGGVGPSAPGAAILPPAASSFLPKGSMSSRAVGAGAPGGVAGGGSATATRTGSQSSLASTQSKKHVAQADGSDEDDEEAF